MNKEVIVRSNIEFLVIESLYPYIGVSRCGKIFDIKRAKIKTFTHQADNYKTCSTISYNGERKNVSVHRLVAIYYIPNPKNYPIINHINEIKQDNRAENLEWCTTEYNIRYSINRCSQEKWERQYAYWEKNEPSLFYRVKILQKYFGLSNRDRVDTFFSINLDNYKGKSINDAVLKKGIEHLKKTDVYKERLIEGLPSFKSHGNRI
jgi:hypothetical protein